MATTKNTTTKTTGKKLYRVRDGLVCRMSSAKTLKSGETVELTDSEYEKHKLVLETEEQYQSRQKSTEIEGES